MIAYSRECSWWDLLENAACAPDCLTPCCPHCGTVAKVMDKEAWMQFQEQLADHDASWLDFVVWVQGKCFPTVPAAKLAYYSTKETK